MTPGPEKTRLRLVPGFDRETMPWLVDDDLERQFSSALVQSGPSDDEVTVTLQPADGAEPIDQVWRRGRVCAICTGDMGPSGKQLCEVPLSEDEDDACASP